MKKQNGFTLVEVIIVVAVLAAVVTIAMPDINRLFARQQEMTETSRLKSIYRSLDVYAKVNKKLPDELQWYKQLAPFSELSELQIQKDVWGENRIYERSEKSHGYLGGSYTAYYAVVLSKGSDKTLAATTTLPTTYNLFKSFDLASSVVENNGINDLAIKYTDQPNKIELMEKTLDRMEKLSVALSRYARVKQISGVTRIPYVSDQYIYYPKDGSTNGGKYYEGTINNGGTNVSIPTAEAIDDITDASIGGEKQAISLAVTLGLPEDYGRDAVTDETMYYISNPGADASSACTGSRATAPFYPPIITVKDPC